MRGGEVTRARVDLPACVQRTIVFVKPAAQPEIELALTWYDGSGQMLSDTTGGRWPAGMAAETKLAFAPGSYCVVAIDQKRGLRGERAFAIGAGDPAAGRIEVVLR